MNQYLFIAGTLCLILGLVHSILGEFLIFKNLKKSNKIIPTIATSKLKERHLRIIWATWHLTSLFGWCIGVLLIKIGTMQTEISVGMTQFMIACITITMLSASFLVFIATKGKHLGWIVLLIIGITPILGMLK
ncbi:hypothetical protein H7U19_05550 [Hyunsoonleella sp. SJ7]|uniref:Uncharacterized protein n=1 Tax=Hyunsoonleella aquatilis TaxID=2762758 RepID=A0A923HEB6_9FLAO|nr:hypothetical protein [Hyunsoonleella aquatilis]MBC3757860.1 hypothetical protein [Hyunsoonleella aquatilis]